MGTVKRAENEGGLMCEFCVKHGDGKRWYLNAANYAEDLLADLRRQKYIEEFVPEVTANAARYLRIIDRGKRISPTTTNRIAAVYSNRMKKIHFGQVIPLEDAAAILDIVGQVVRLPCVCRQVLQKKEKAVCYLLTVSPDKLGLREILGRREESLPFVNAMEKVDPKSALSEMASLEDERMIHTVWTFITPFIGAICNCDSTGCLAVNFTNRGLRLYWPGEEVIDINHENCTGCRACVDICPFSALSVTNGGPAREDSNLCHGCGICRKSCPSKALFLRSRNQSSPPGGQRNQ